MPTRELSPPPTSLERPSRLHKKPPSAGNPLKRKDSSFNLRQRIPTPIDAPKRTLSPASSNTMNRGPTTTESSPKVLSSTPNGAGNTIRSVPNNDYRLEASPSRNGDRNMPISRGHSPIPTSHPPPSSLAQVAHPPPSSLAVRQQPISRSISTEFGTTKSYTNGNGNNGFPIAEDGSAQGGQWSSAVGRANLGKSGRVIERLMGENDMLKRDITIERLRAEESKQELKMAESRMEQQSSDYEAKLHEAAINKTLLKRRERQLADLKTQVDGEKANAQRALESEKYWRDEADRERWEAQIKVDDANNRSMMFEGRYNTVVDHWEDQGAVVEKAMGKMRRQIAEVNELRAEDARRMNMMEALSNQQAKELDGLRGEKDAIAAQFEAYKAEQERLLKDIKESAKSQEIEQETQIAEAKRLVGELKWAINVQKNVRDTH